MFVFLLVVLCRFQRYFSYLTQTIHLIIHDISTRLGNVPYPRALHRDRYAATGDRTRFQIPDTNHSATADSSLNRPRYPGYSEHIFIL